MFMTLYEVIDMKIACTITEATKVHDFVEMVQDMGIKFSMSQNFSGEDIIIYKIRLHDVSERSLKLLTDFISA